MSTVWCINEATSYFQHEKVWWLLDCWQFLLLVNFCKNSGKVNAFILLEKRKWGKVKPLMQQADDIFSFEKYKNKFYGDKPSLKREKRYFKDNSSYMSYTRMLKISTFLFRLRKQEWVLTVFYNHGASFLEERCFKWDFSLEKQLQKMGNQKQPFKESGNFPWTKHP